MDKDLEELERESFYEDDNKDVPPADIVAFNELRSCADLYRMYEEKILEIQPEFQREVVWREPGQTRFIDSIIKQLPIPSMCFSFDYKTQKWQVIDGLQRMSSIIKFLDGGDWKLSKLDDIDQRISGKRASLFKDKGSDLYPLYQRVQNLTLPITVLRCDYSKTSHKNYLFTIFHRLNSGGMKLNNQEIRNCIYIGSFNEFLKISNSFNYWQTLQDIEIDKVYRFAKVELILRFFAFFEDLDNYKGKLARFLNEFMDKNKNASVEDLAARKKVFEEVCREICTKITNNKPFENAPNSVFEAVMYGIAKNIDFIGTCSKKLVNEMYIKLRDNPEFSDENLKSSLSDKDKVTKRLKAAEIIFSGK